MAVRSVHDVLLSPNRSLAYLRKDNPNMAKAILVELLADVLDYLNVTNTMNDSQIATTVNLILEDYAVFKAEDFALCFNRAKKGQYGTTYNRIDGQIIFEWLEKYSNERLAEIEQIQQENHKRTLKRLEETKPVAKLPDWVTEMAKKNLPENAPKFIERPQTEEQKAIQSAMADFDKIWMGQGSKPGKKFIDLNGKMLDLNEYLKIIFHEN